jgi:hypothetical protein
VTVTAIVGPLPSRTPPILTIKTVDPRLKPGRTGDQDIGDEEGAERDHKVEEIHHHNKEGYEKTGRE